MVYFSHGITKKEQCFYHINNKIFTFLHHSFFYFFMAFRYMI